MTSAKSTDPKSVKASDALKKEASLRSMMRELGTVLVAYSGGVDSSYLAFVAHKEIGSDALAVLGVSPSVSQVQRDEARSFAKAFELNFAEIETAEARDPNYITNPTNRCFFCKDELFSCLAAIALEKGISAVIDGTNYDDISGHRPGLQAAEQNGVRSPLAEVGLTKEEIRYLSGSNGLPDWDKPASPCLASRIAYGTPVTIGRLNRVEKGEAILRAEGFREFRLRVNADNARIEVGIDELARALDPAMSKRLGRSISALGFETVSVDLDGFRSGSLNGAGKPREISIF